MTNIQLIALTTTAIVGGGYIAEKLADKTIEFLNRISFIKINETASYVLKGIAMLTGAVLGLAAVSKHHSSSLMDKEMIKHLYKELKGLRIQLNDLQTPEGCMPIPLRPFVIKFPHSPNFGIMDLLRNCAGRP